MAYTEPEGDSDLRRRALWLLVMLAVVAVLLIVVVSALVSSSDVSTGSGGPGPLDTAATSPADTSQSHHPSRHRTSSSSSAAQQTSSSTPAIGGSTDCPSAELCVLAGDPGNGIAAINEYRTQNGRPAVPGSVSTQAQDCALSNGNGCSGAWAETWDSRRSGTVMAHKLISLGHLLDPMTSFEVGWAYDPKSKIYYFAIIRNA